MKTGSSKPVSPTELLIREDQKPKMTHRRFSIGQKVGKQPKPNNNKRDILAHTLTHTLTNLLKYPPDRGVTCFSRGYAIIYPLFFSPVVFVLKFAAFRAINWREHQASKNKTSKQQQHTLALCFGTRHGRKCVIMCTGKWRSESRRPERNRLFCLFTLLYFIHA